MYVTYYVLSPTYITTWLTTTTITPHTHTHTYTSLLPPGVSFRSPHDGTLMMLSPEMSMSIQNKIGADIIMQLDDVVSSTLTGPRVKEAMLRFVQG